MAGMDEALPEVKITGASAGADEDGVAADGVADPKLNEGLGRLTVLVKTVFD